MIDYPQFAMKPKNFLFPSVYIDVFNGVYPREYPSKKKWFIDVDHLYACHHLRGHWLALDIDLHAKKILVYDSIPSVASESDIVDTLKVYSRMIPAILNLMVPSKIRKKSNAQFTVRRVKNIPLNEKPGDCGVFSIKYVECLALGCTFDGLCDKNILAIRKKLAADLFNEVEEALPPQMSNPLPRGEELDRVPLLTDSQP